MLEKIKQLIASTDVIVLTGPGQSGKSWLIEKYNNQPDICSMDDAHLSDSAEILELCRAGLSEGKKVILAAQFRSQVPVIGIKALCNEKHKSLLNIDLAGWDEEKAEPSSFTSF
ncbi:hypothetical protein L3Q72_15535 [Vibrio sp. JC009]|uniref:hypothetical protein n=1 Tax=Vibrio sp. JC009 TaxID=2912314 RepID=UPI0023AEED97|nr:hypothetical protein [Vibrio sp. JC009]WED24293.1 hypothetical protein L3Q72_15535 [Vibrio sp. JC009]